MSSNCMQCLKQFELSKEDLSFFERIAPIFNGKKYIINSPSLCVKCRHQRRLVVLNARNLYNRKCDATNMNIISIYDKDSLYKVFDKQYWQSDSWDPIDYGKDFDFNKSFFENLYEFSLTMPKNALSVLNNENCDYCNIAYGSKDSYLSYSVARIDKCYYMDSAAEDVSCMDCSFTYYSELCYSCVDVGNSYDIKYCFNSHNCSNSYFLHSCIGCKSCLFCTNLRQKEYCIYNKQYSKQEYLKKLSEIDFGNIEMVEKLKNKFNDFVLKYPKKFALNISCENTTGDGNGNMKNCINCFDSGKAENCKNIYLTVGHSGLVFDSQDIDFTDTIEASYDTINTGNNKFVLFCLDLESCNNCYYSSYLTSCSNCFACEGLKHKSYCIFNKQYSKEQYEILVSKIVDHMQETKEWGEFPPIELSPFAYNETVAQEYFPLTKEEAGNTYSKGLFNNDAPIETRLIASLHQDHNQNKNQDQDHNQSIQKGWKWKDQDDQIPDVTKIIPASKLPDTIKDIPDDIQNWAIRCEKTNRPFKIIAQELEFYRKHNIPIPHLHPDQGHKERIMLRNPRRLFNRKCMKCDKQIQTSYAPEKPEIVYCEECYVEEVY